MIKLNKDTKRLIVPSNIGNSNTQTVVGHTDEEMEEKYQEGYEKGIEDGLKEYKLAPCQISYSQQEDLVEVDLTCLDGSKLNSARGMFNNCYSLENVNWGGLVAPNVTDLFSMYHYCSNLKSVDFTPFTGCKITEISNVCFHCHELEEIDISMIDVSECKQFSQTFRECKKLKTLNISNWDMRKATNLDMLIYVSRELENLIVENTQWPDINYTYFTDNRNLTRKSLVDLFNALPYSDKNSTYRVSTQQNNRLLDGDLDILRNKNWNVTIG